MNKKIIFIVLSLVYIFSAISIFAEVINNSQQITAGTAEEYFNRGNAHKKQGNLPQAIADYTKAIEINPQHAKAYYNRGNTYEKQDNHAQAISDYAKAIEINPKYKEAYYNRGNTYGKQHNLMQATSDYTKAIEIDSKYAAAYGNRGNIYQIQSNFKQAIEDYNKAIEIHPEIAGFYSNRGNAYQAQGKLDQAIIDYNKAIEISPEIAGFYSNRGNAYQTRNNLNKAIADYSKAIELNPNDNATYYNRGLAYYGMEQYGKSFADYTTATNNNPSMEAYEDFIKYVPVKKVSDTGNIRNAILQLFAEKLNLDRKMAMPAPVAAPVAASVAKPTTELAKAPVPAATSVHSAQVNSEQNKTKSLPEEDVKHLVLKWTASWESGDMETYRSCYMSDFQSKGLNLNKWVSYKSSVRKKSKDIKISIDDLKISTDGNAAKAVFTQSYRSSILKDKGKKILELRKINDGWKIYKEIM